MDKIIKATKEVGFPVVMSLILVYIVFVSLANNTTAIDNLTYTIKTTFFTSAERSLDHD